MKGKVAVITGAGRGLGKCHALALAAEGAKVVVNDLGGAPDGTGGDRAPTDEVVAEIKKMGGEAVANYDTVTTMEGGERIINTAIDSFGGATGSEVIDGSESLGTDLTDDHPVGVYLEHVTQVDLDVVAVFLISRGSGGHG